MNWRRIVVITAAGAFVSSEFVGPEDRKLFHIPDEVAIEAPVSPGGLTDVGTIGWTRTVSHTADAFIV